MPEESLIVLKHAKSELSIPIDNHLLKKKSSDLDFVIEMPNPDN